MKHVFLAAGIAVMATGTLFAADQTFTGKISDSRCGVNHNAMQEHNKNLTDRACTEACVKGGAKYVLSSGGKVYQIDNQKDAALAMYAGDEVTVTGELSGNTIRAAKISKPSSR
jgi:hypothetical protein